MAFKNLSKFYVVIVFVGVLFSTNFKVSLGMHTNCISHVLLEHFVWIHGSSDCSRQTDPLIQVVQYDCNTWIFRQNKCISPDAPFMYLFMGEESSLLIDTGATRDEELMPLYEIVNGLLESRNKTSVPLIVAHTNSMSSHSDGDIQFMGRPNVVVVGLMLEQVREFFQFFDWPNDMTVIDLGGRTIIAIASPGHDKTSITFYDTASRLLVTGDTFFPGRLNILDYDAYKETIKRLFHFALQYHISYIVGSHIEMTSTPAVDFPIDSTYQPEEQKLPLDVGDLGLLNDVLQTMMKPSEKISFDKFIVVPEVSAHPLKLGMRVEISKEDDEDY